MARVAQGSGNGWVASRPVGGLGRMPTLDQKEFRGKTIKLIMTSSIKRP